MFASLFTVPTIILNKQQSCDAKCMYRISAHSLLVTGYYPLVAYACSSASLVDASVKIDLTEQQERNSVIDSAGKEKGLICDILTRCALRANHHRDRLTGD